MTTSNLNPAARVWAEIDLHAVLSNARTVADASGVRLLPMVKAGGYGLGAAPVARILERVDPWGFGVATVDEGAELRDAGVTRPIVAFSPLLPSAISGYRRNNLRPAIGDIDALRAWRAAEGNHPFHLEIDTGMARAGVRWNDREQLGKILELIGSAGCEGVFTHFHSADESTASLDEQWRRFEGVVRAMPRRPALVHAANSSAALRDRRFGGDLVRPGIFLYGGEAGGRYPSVVVRLQARVLAVRRVETGDTVGYGAGWTATVPTTIATLGIGYADGLLRSLGGRGKIELNGHLGSIAGRISMDMTMIAMPDGVAVAPGDIATIFGGRVTLDQQAAWAGTISYELLTSMSRRVERNYNG